MFIKLTNVYIHVGIYQSIFCISYILINSAFCTLQLHFRIIIIIVILATCIVLISTFCRLQVLELWIF